jgi:hypothetical protein
MGFSSRIVRAVLVLTALVPAAASAQSGTGTIAGIVRDTSGGAIPGVSVRVVNEDTGVAVEAVTYEQGSYQST